MNYQEKIFKNAMYITSPINIGENYYCLEEAAHDYDDGIFFDNGNPTQDIFIKCPYQIGSIINIENVMYEVKDVKVINENNKYYFVTEVWRNND